MLNDATMNKMNDLCCLYLSPLTAGPWTIQGACVTARTETSYLVTAASQVVRLLIEKPEEGWAIAFEIVQHGGAIQRLRVEGFDGVTDTRGADEVRIMYLRWLKSVAASGRFASEAGKERHTCAHTK